MQHRIGRLQVVVKRQTHLVGPAFLMCLAFGNPAVSQQSRPPLPPVRPQLAAPAVQPNVATPRPAPPVEVEPLALDPDHPPLLPQASRAKMHACGREWQDMKSRGADKDTTWRQFATACLTRD